MRDTSLAVTRQTNSIARNVMERSDTPHCSQLVQVKWVSLHLRTQPLVIHCFILDPFLD